MLAAIWHNTDTADPGFGPAASASIAKTAQAADAAMEVLLDDISIGELESVIFITPAASGDMTPTGLGARYLVIEIQPKGTGFPPNRAYVMLRKT